MLKGRGHPRGHQIRTQLKRAFSACINYECIGKHRVLNLSTCSQGYNTLWPLPQKYLVEPMGTAVLLSTSFAIETNQSSEVLDRAIQRYSSIIMEHDVNRKFSSACGNATISISKLYIEVTSQDESLNADTSYNYSLMVDEGNAKITASTIYGAM